jgi:hypothetical protein
MACYNETAFYNAKLKSLSFAGTALHMRLLLWQMSKAGRPIVLDYVRLAVTASFFCQGDFTEICRTAGTYTPQKLTNIIDLHIGRDVAQAVSRWLPTAPAQVRVRTTFEVCGGQNGTGAQAFSEYFGFPCELFHQFLHHHNHPGLAQ